jgi:Flp pilus assembly protein TadD
MGQFEFGAATAEFDRLARSDPQWREAQINLAIATLNRQQEGDEARAARMLRELASASPPDNRARYVLALLLLHDGAAVEAEKLLREASMSDPRDPHAAYFLAQSVFMQHRYEEAFAAFQRAIEIDPLLRSAWYGASQSLAQLGRVDESKVSLAEFQRLASNPVARLAEFKYTRMGQKSEALDIDAPAARRTPPGGALLAPPITVGHLDLNGAKQGIEISVADTGGTGTVDTIFVSGGAAAKSFVLRGGGTLWAPVPDHPLARLSSVNAVVWADVDNDGIVDAILCRAGSPPLLYRQHPRGSWRDTTPSAFRAARADRDCAAFDADHDGDVDLFAISGDGRRTLLNNNLDGTFRDLSAHLPHSAAGRAIQVVAADLDNDRSLDLIVLREGGPHEVLENRLAWTYRPATGFEEFKRSPALAAVAVDADGDGQVEIFTLTPALSVLEWRRAGDGTWKPRERVAGTAGRAHAGRLALVDLDGDGRPEIVKSEEHGWSVWHLTDSGAEKIHQVSDATASWHAAVLGPRGASIIDLLEDGTLRLHAPGPGRSGFASVTFSGRGDEGQSMRSNASGIGTRYVARIAGGAVTGQALRPDSGPGQDLAPIAIGIGGDPRIDYLVIDWPDGVFQTELAIASGESRRIVETQRQLSSCPLVFTWNGERIVFSSDILGVGGLGYLEAPGEYAAARPWENFLLPEGALAARDGRYIVKIVEPMEEATYLDQLRLVAYDLPPGWDMVLDERMGASSPQPTGRAVYYREWLDPVRAVNDRGEDVTQLVSHTDAKAAPTGPRDPRFIGRLLRPHVLTLEFSAPVDRPGATLMIDGWIEYPYSQTMFAAFQAHADYQAPTIEAQDAEGRWRVVLKEFGYPAGMPRRMSVPLDRLPKGTRSLRITTNQEIYFDRVAVLFAAKPEGATRNPLRLASARVQPVGFPRLTMGPQAHPSYDYSRRSPLWDVRMQTGRYTAYGDATALIAEHDDALAIIGPGDEVHAEFEAIPGTLRQGWTRRYVLESHGWAKDMDLYTDRGDSLEPIPRSGRPGAAPRLLHEQYNTRHASGR